MEFKFKFKKYRKYFSSSKLFFDQPTYNSLNTSWWLLDLLVLIYVFKALNLYCLDNKKLNEKSSKGIQNMIFQKA